MSATESTPSVPITDAEEISDLAVAPANVPGIENVSVLPSPHGQDVTNDLRTPTDSDMPASLNDGENDGESGKPLDAEEIIPSGEMDGVSTTGPNSDDARGDEGSADQQHRVEEEEEAAGYLFALS